MTFGWEAMLAASMVAAALVAALPRRLLLPAMLLWVASPALAYIAIILWEAATRPVPDHLLGTAFYGFVLISGVFAVPWLVVCLITFGVGLLLRRLVRSRTVPRAEPSAITPDPVVRHVSPDGAIVVELLPTEWANSHWVYGPRVTAGERVLLDLWGTNWDAVVSFPGPAQARLSLRRYGRALRASVLIDAARGTYRIDDGLAAPLAGVARGLDVASACADERAGLSVPAATPNRRAAWRAALLILGGATVAIGAAAFVARSIPSPSVTQTIPVPAMPSFR